MFSDYKVQLILLHSPKDQESQRWTVGQKRKNELFWPVHQRLVEKTHDPVPVSGCTSSLGVAIVFWDKITTTRFYTSLWTNKCYVYYKHPFYI